MELGFNFLWHQVEGKFGAHECPGPLLGWRSGKDVLITQRERSWQNLNINWHVGRPGKKNLLSITRK